MALTDGKHDVMLFSDEGKAVRFDEDDVRPMGRGARGVRGMKLAEGGKVIALAGRGEREQSVLTATENGYGKRTPIAEYTRHGRGTQGMIAIQTSRAQRQAGRRHARRRRRRDHADHHRRRADPHARERDPRDGPLHPGRDADQPRTRARSSRAWRTSWSATTKMAKTAATATARKAARRKAATAQGDGTRPEGGDGGNGARTLRPRARSSTSAPARRCCRTRSSSSAKWEMLDWHGSGMSVMEMSHRGKEFIGIAAEAEADLRELLGDPANYKVLFLQGGATLQFAGVPDEPAARRDEAPTT